MREDILDALRQVNTSGEDSKGGCAPADAPQLVRIHSLLPVIIDTVCRPKL